MSYTTAPIANRISYRQGWSNPLNSQSRFNHPTEQISQLKGYFLLLEYFKLNHLQLLSTGLCQNSHVKVLTVALYKKIYQPHLKHSTPHDYCKLPKENLARIVKVSNGDAAFKFRRPAQRKLYFFAADYRRCIRTSRRQSRTLVRHHWTRYFRQPFVVERCELKTCEKQHEFWKKVKQVELPPRTEYKVSSARVSLQRQKWNSAVGYKPLVAQQPLSLATANDIVPKKRSFFTPTLKRKFYTQAYNYTDEEILTLARITYAEQKLYRLKYLLEHYSCKWLSASQAIKLHAPFRLFARKSIYNNEHKWYAVRAFYRQPYFKQFLYALKTGQHHVNPQLIAELIADELVRTHRRHKQLARNVSVLLADFRPSYVKGFKFRLTGKLDGKDESRGEWFRDRKSPEVPTQQFNKRITYAFAVSRTYTGLFGVKLWVHY